MCRSLDGYRMEGGEWPTDHTVRARSGEEHVKQLHLGEGRVGVVNEFVVTVSAFLTHHVGERPLLCAHLLHLSFDMSFSVFVSPPPNFT